MAEGTGSTGPEERTEPPRALGLARWRERVAGFWRALSRPWRWVIVVAPGVALVVGIVGDTLSLWDRLTSGDGEVAVQNVAVSQDGTVDLLLTSVADETFRLERVSPATSVTFSLNNPRETAVAFFAVRATVLDAAVVRDCAIAGGDLQVTGNYQLALPDPEVGATASTEIAWEVPGNRNDRFRVTMGHPRLTGLEQVPFYRLLLELRAGDGGWLPAGTVVLANELPHFGAFFDRAEEGFGQCPTDNLAVMRRFLEAPGARSPELALLGQTVVAIDRAGSAGYVGPDCREGDPRVNDVYPFSVGPDAHELQLAVAVECREADGFENAGVLVEVVSRARPDVALLTYAPGPPVRATDLTVTDGTLRLSYTRLGATLIQVEEELAIVDGTLTVVNRTTDAG